MKVDRYELELDVDHAELAYQGRNTVHLEHDGGPLLLHAVGLEIEGVRLAGGGPLSWKARPEQEGIEIEGVPKGPAAVDVAFRGKVPENALMGAYRSDYGEGHAIVTQLEPLGARRVFPCVDHPAQKASFHLRVATAPGLQVITNMPAKEERSEGERLLRIFEPTPRMSTYLFFLGVGRFEERTRERRGMRVIVATPPGRGGQAGFALEQAARVLDFFESYFGVPYPLPKLHLIAVPNTAVGGMENWGAITFRERVLLVPDDASPMTLRSVMGVIAHEIAHQWFGDLVTMAWWNDLWLNESFATFMDYKATSALHPEWEVWADFATGTSNAQLWDALPHSHPVNVPVKDPNQIASIFDEISYAKGGSILRMIEAYVGEEAFRAGVARYLRRYSFTNARGEDLWAAIDEGSELKVAPVLRAWIDRPGYPAVRAVRQGEDVELSQHRFLLGPPSPGNGPSGAPAADAPWPLPINVLADGKARGHMMDGRQIRLPLRDPASLVVNHGRRSFTRVRYEGALAEGMRGRFAALDPWDRWGLLQDTYAFLLAGEAGPAEYLPLLAACAKETSYIVLRDFQLQLGTLMGVLDRSPSFRRTVRACVVAQVDRLDLLPRAKESAWEGPLREGFAASRVFLDETFAVSMAERWPTWEKEPPVLRRAIALGFARTKGLEAFDPLVARMKAARSDEEKGRCAAALGMFRDEAAITRALALPFGGEVSPATGLDILAAALSNPDARDAMWATLKEAFPFLLQTFGGTGVVPLVLQWSVPYLGLGREQEVREFFAHLDVGEGRAGLTKGLDLLGIYAAVRSRFASYDGA